MLYLDNAATTRVHKRVVDKMMLFLDTIYGNANSRFYNLAVDSRKAVEEARANISKLLNCTPDNIIFTSGSTESNNFILKSLYFDDKLKHVITSKVEHSSIIETCKFLEKKKIKVTYLDVNQEGVIDLNELKSNINKDTSIVTLMYVNNEIGSINPMHEVSKICKDSGVLLHVDATQAVGKIKIDLSKLECDYMSISSHKIYGPKGVGALYKRNTLQLLTPLIHGGEQENGERGGTLATHQIVGFGEAAKICYEDLENNIKKLENDERKLIEKLEFEFNNDIEIVNKFKNKIPGIVSVRFKGINNEVFLKAVSEKICASTGAACSNSNPSHVLQALGYSLDQIREVVRFSISAYDDYRDFEELS
jgi:cysteine desulfurase